MLLSFYPITYDTSLGKKNAKATERTKAKVQTLSWLNKEIYTIPNYNMWKEKASRRMVNDLSKKTKDNPVYHRQGKKGDDKQVQVFFCGPLKKS